MSRELVEVADGVRVGRLVPGPWLNVIVLDGGVDGDVVVDAGLPWSAGRLGRLLGRRRVASHVVTHAHADHTGATSWLCRVSGASLQMGAGDADRFESGRIDTHGGAAVRAAFRRLDPTRMRVDRRLREGDAVGAFLVVEAPGHSPGNIALWRESDRVLVVGDSPVNVSRDAARPRWVRLPAALDHDRRTAHESRRRLAALDPALVVPVHGHAARDVRAWADPAVTG